ncbi:hypothetical protein [Peribacillus simplex]|uniref:hypothetical protein n=1 Tax=Peribacillus simplex TaxID=1478 RepID=UPI0024C1680C|nr:hypothetical protein [Peribacillus simplex]WHY56213.1 hypothetical protein QNH43_24300 [Peribacillus simplex]
MTNPNLVQNGGFEQSTPPALPPFWSGSGETQSGGSQLLGNNNARLLTPGETITQTLLPLQVGQFYTFQAAFTTPAGSGTIDVNITGEATHKFQASNMIDTTTYAFYNFDFIASTATPTLTITNNSDAFVHIDVVSVKRENPNLVQNGGFEQSDENAADELAPFWIGTGSINTGGQQLLGNNNGDIGDGEFIAQALLPLQVGEVYEFKAAIVFDSTPTTGTIDVDITGTSTRRFQAVNISNTDYIFYSFTFVANEANAALAIANNSDGSINIDVVSVKRVNPNLVQNGGFEQSTPPALPPFWSGSGETQSGVTQLLGDNNVRILVGENITQTLLPLQVGEHYQFLAAFSTSAATGTIDVDITGISTRTFQADSVSSGSYIFYNFDFIATGTTASLIITNNSNADLRVDVVSVKLA